MRWFIVSDQNLQSTSVHKTIQQHFWFEIHLILLKKTTNVVRECSGIFFYYVTILYDASLSPQWILQKICYEEWIILISANFIIKWSQKRGVKIVQKQLPSPVCLTFCHKTWSIFSETWIIMGNSTVTSVYQQSQGGTMSYNDQLFSAEATGMTHWDYLFWKVWRRGWVLVISFSILSVFYCGQK